MPIVASSSSKTYELPTEGTHQAVLAQVKDLGELDTQYGKKHKVQFKWQVAELDKDGDRRSVVERFTLSLHQKASLRKRIKSVFGKEPPATMDIEKLVGSNCQLVITHAEVDGKKYANIAAVLRLPEGAAKLEPVVKPDQANQAKSEEPAPRSNAVTAANPINDEDIPF